MRRAARRDGNEPDVIAELRANGYSVTQLDERGVPDIVVGGTALRLYNCVSCGQPNSLRFLLNWLLEVKDPNAERGRAQAVKLTDDQVIWHGDWRGQKAIIESPEQALRVVRGAA